MMPREITLSDLRLLSLQTEPGRINLEWQLATEYNERVSLIEDALRWIGQEFTKTRQVRQGRSEDAFTIDIITALKAMNIDAHHDAQYGGHCDIVVEAARNFLWLAEAKIHSDYNWLLQGFNQLDTRYATGLPGQEYGAMIVYSYNIRTDLMMTAWHGHLKSNRCPINVGDITTPRTEFRSTHVHQTTGADFKVWHMAISLYFDPKDK